MNRIKGYVALYRKGNKNNLPHDVFFEVPQYGALTTCLFEKKANLNKFMKRFPDVRPKKILKCSIEITTIEEVDKCVKPSKVTRKPRVTKNVKKTKKAKFCP
jgi:hypothetical protein